MKIRPYFRRLTWPTKIAVFSSAADENKPIFVNFIPGPTKIAIFVGIWPIFVSLWPTIAYFPVAMHGGSYQNRSYYLVYSSL
jgi:hypothetical protein